MVFTEPMSPESQELPITPFDKKWLEAHCITPLKASSTVVIALKAGELSNGPTAKSKKDDQSIPRRAAALDLYLD